MTLPSFSRSYRSRKPSSRGSRLLGSGPHKLLDKESVWLYGSKARELTSMTRKSTLGAFHDLPHGPVILTTLTKKLLRRQPFNHSIPINHCLELHMKSLARRLSRLNIGTTHLPLLWPKRCAFPLLRHGGSRFMTRQSFLPSTTQCEIAILPPCYPTEIAKESCSEPFGSLPPHHSTRGSACCTCGRPFTRFRLGDGLFFVVRYEWYYTLELGWAGVGWLAGLLTVLFLEAFTS